MLWACILLPQLALDAVLRRHPDPDAPLALVREGFAPAMWLGLAYFVGLCVFFYRRVLRK